MKATQYAITVQYGGGFHSFVAYHTEPGAAMVEAQDRSTSLNAEYDKKTGRRGVRPTVMVWEKMGTIPYADPKAGPSETEKAIAAGTSVGALEPQATAGLNGADLLQSTPAPLTIADERASNRVMDLVVLPLGALEGGE
jgi:hypothetical protein